MDDHGRAHVVQEVGERRGDAAAPPKGIACIVECRAGTVGCQGGLLGSHSAERGDDALRACVFCTTWILWMHCVRSSEMGSRDRSTLLDGRTEKVRTVTDTIHGAGNEVV